jgi:hypothetical protein
MGSAISILEFEQDPCEDEHSSSFFVMTFELRAL